MQLKTIKDIKLELRRIRKRQDKHNNNELLNRRKSQLREKLWKLLKAQPRTRKSPKPKRATPKTDESEHQGKPKGTGRYV